MKPYITRLTTNVVGLAAGAELDSYSGFFGICRAPNETDAMLRARVNTIMSMPRPDPMTQRLFHLLYRLGLRSPKQFLPAGI